MYIVIDKNAVAFSEKYKPTDPAYYLKVRPTVLIYTFNTLREAEAYCYQHKTMEYIISKMVAESTLVTPTIKHHS